MHITLCCKKVGTIGKLCFSYYTIILYCQVAILQFEYGYVVPRYVVLQTEVQILAPACNPSAQPFISHLLICWLTTIDHCRIHIRPFICHVPLFLHACNNEITENENENVADLGVTL